MPEGTENGGRPGARVRLKLLGGFAIFGDGDELALPLSAQRLVAFLALNDGPLLRLYVAGILWPEVPEKRAYANLRSALWRLRRTGFEIVEATGAHLRLPASVSVDAHDALALAKRVVSSRDARLERAGPLAADLLPDWDDDWIVAEREHLRQLRLHALEALAERLTDDGRFALAAEAGLAAIESDPLRDSANRALIRVFLAEGNRSEAVRCYRRYRSRLERELGLEPSPQMKDLLGPVPGLTAPPL
jgi:DNA-binding SARP family transcriptional activator